MQREHQAAKGTITRYAGGMMPPSILHDANR
jgi:hypothetical protein